MKHIQHDYACLASEHGVKVMYATVTGMDPVKKKITPVDGKSLGYDRLVLSPGIDFNYEAIFPVVYTRLLILQGLSSTDYYLHLLFYNLVYLVPLAVIVLVFVWTLGTRKLQ